MLMQYQGGKSRISKFISEEINALSRWKIKNSKTIIGNNNVNNSRREVLTFVSLFCGSCAVECKITEFSKMILNDNHKYLIALYKGLQNGYQLPDDISETEYKYVCNHKEDDEVLTGFVGFGCSFGGKWFGGYGRSKGRSHAQESKRALLRDMKILQNAEFICKDYRDVALPDNCVIYADPPYNNTTGYGKKKFNSEEFWKYAREVSKNHLMFISEQIAPDDFISIWEKPFTRTLDVNKNNQFKVTEKLFIHSKYKYLVETSNK